MRPGIRRVFAIILVFVSAVGLILTVIGVSKVWQVKAAVTSSMLTNLQLADDLLNTSSEGLVVVEDTLDTVSTNVDSLQTATVQLAASIHDSQPMLVTLENLTRVDIPATISSTQTSLASAQNSARLIDSMLTTISRLPFLGLGQYAPNPPLSESLAQVSTNIDALMPSLVTVTQSLKDAQTNLSNIETQVTQIGDEISKINSNLENARLIVNDYKVTITSLQAQVQSGITNVPTWLDTAAWGVTLVLVWMMVTQLVFLVVGLTSIRV